MNCLARVLGGQLRAPHGIAGRLLAHGMAKANRVAVEQTIRAAEIGPEDAVLDLGCGGGEALGLLRREAPRGYLFGVDHSPLMVDRARRINPAADVRLVSFDALPFPDGSFDRILAINVAYFWYDASRMVAELRRVLRPGGRIVVYFTDAVHLRRVGLATSGTHRLWTVDEMMALFGGRSGCIDIAASRHVAGHIVIFDEGTAKVTS